MLPQDMFLNLIDTELQTRIALSDDLDGIAAESLKLLLEMAPTSMTTGLNDWTIEKTNGQTILFYKGKNYIPRNDNLRRDIVRSFHDHKQQDTPAKSGPITRYGNIIGGLDYELLSKTMSRDAAFANSSKLIDHQQNQHTYPWKVLNHCDPLLIVRWI